MPRCYFHLCAQARILRDSIGTECPDLAAARAKARAVAIDLMRNSGGETRLWSLRVVDEQGKALFDLFFADVAASLDGGSRADQELSAATCRRLTALSDALSDARDTVAQSRILLARARGKPQLVYDSTSGRI